MPTSPPGGYGVELFEIDGEVLARSAFDVTDPQWSVLRCGFVSDCRPGRAFGYGLVESAPPHLTAVQFYDWGYRYADLLRGDPDYPDALGQPVSLAAVQTLIRGLYRVGAQALGYGAVYGVGEQEWPAWKSVALLTPRRQSVSLGGVCCDS